MAANSTIQKWRLFPYILNLSVPIEYDGHNLMPVPVWSLAGLVASASSFLEGSHHVRNPTRLRLPCCEKPALATQSERMATWRSAESPDMGEKTSWLFQQVQPSSKAKGARDLSQLQELKSHNMVSSKQSQPAHSCLSYPKGDPCHPEAEMSHFHVFDTNTCEKNKIIIILRCQILG